MAIETVSIRQLNQAEAAIKMISLVTKIRNLIQKVTGESAGSVLQAEHAYDNAKYAQFFEEISVTATDLAQRRDAVFDPGGFGSMTSVGYCSCLVGKILGRLFAVPVVLALLSGLGIPPSANCVMRFPMHL